MATSTSQDLESRIKAKEAEANNNNNYTLDLPLCYEDSERVGRKYFQILVALSANMGMASYGHVFCSSAFLIPQLEDPETGFGITNEQGSWLASLLVLGSLSGALCGSWQSERYGKRLSMLFDNLLLMCSTMMVALAPTYPVVLVGRMLSGHAAASSMVAIPIYTGEISQPQVRKSTGIFTTACFSFGFAYQLILGALLPWRWAIGIGALTQLSTFIMLFFCPESPAWLHSKGHEKEAREAMTRLRGQHNTDIVDAEIKRIAFNLKMELNEEEAEQKQSMVSKAKELFSDSTFVRPFLVLVIVFSIGLEWTGLPAIAFYMVPLLKSTNIPMDPYWAAAGLASYRAVIAIFAAPVIKSCRRRVVYIGAACLLSVGTFTLATYMYMNLDGQLIVAYPVARYTPLLAILLIYTAFSFGFGPIIYILQGEILPARARSFGSGLLGIIDNTSLFFASKLVPTWNHLLGVHGAFYMHSCICIAVAIFAYFFMPETFGLSLEEIEDYYRNRVAEKQSKDKCNAQKKTVCVVPVPCTLTGTNKM